MRKIATLTLFFLLSRYETSTLSSSPETVLYYIPILIGVSPVCPSYFRMITLKRMVEMCLLYFCLPVFMKLRDVSPLFFRSVSNSYLI